MLEYKAHAHKYCSREEGCEVFVFNALHKGFLFDDWNCIVPCCVQKFAASIYERASYLFHCSLLEFGLNSSFSEVLSVKNSSESVAGATLRTDCFFSLFPLIANSGNAQLNAAFSPQRNFYFQKPFLTRKFESRRCTILRQPPVSS